MFKPDFVAPIVGYLTSKGKRIFQHVLHNVLTSD
jgi:hypothetical protein